MDIFFYFIISFLKDVSLVQIEDGNLNDIFLGLLIKKSLFYKVRVDVNKERCGYCIICFMICLGEQCGLWILY